MCDIWDTVGSHTLHSISENLATTNTRILEAARAAGRDPNGITLIAVSKTKPTAAIEEAFVAGQRDFGENYVQEAVQKVTELAHLDICWHFIGAIQSNKTALLAQHFDWVHTVSRHKIAARLSAERTRLASGRTESDPLDICLQVNVDDDPGKSGVLPDAVAALLEQVVKLPGLRPRGLMTILAKAGDPDLSFRAMNELFRELAPIGGPTWDTLSMGMSQDMEAAIVHGATALRVGSAIFGPRQS